VLFEVALALPPALGMMTGPGYLQVFGYYLKVTHRSGDESRYADGLGGPVALDSERPFDVFHLIARAQWDTMLFLCGIFLSIGGLAYLGWLAAADHLLFGHWGPLLGNVIVGLYSAFIENVPTTFGVLAMEPSLSLGHWLMAALTVATGGSLLSIGSAAGVALMGQAPGVYTFLAHLRWTPAIALGYAAAIMNHLTINALSF
jgi:Na+/H+ antiporter NhaD/arsenite permease-like protein